MFKRAAGVAAALMSFLMMVPVALAQDPTEGGYGGEAPGGQLGGGAGGAGGAGVGGETASGALPFTGLDIVFLLLAGALLIGVGLTMRRLGKVSS